VSCLRVSALFGFFRPTGAGLISSIGNTSLSIPRVDIAVSFSFFGLPPPFCPSKAGTRENVERSHVTRRFNSLPSCPLFCPPDSEDSAGFAPHFPSASFLSFRLGPLSHCFFLSCVGKEAGHICIFSFSSHPFFKGSPRMVYTCSPLSSISC